MYLNYSKIEINVYKRKTFLIFRHILEPLWQACIFRTEFKLQIFNRRTTFCEQTSAQIRLLQLYVLRNVGKVQQKSKMSVTKLRNFMYKLKLENSNILMEVKKLISRAYGKNPIFSI